MAEKKVRSANWTEREKVVLMESVRERESVLMGKLTGSGGCGSVSSKYKDKLWEEVAASVNAVGIEVRTVLQVKKQYDNIKQRAKGKVDELKRPKTGGGPGGAQPTPSESIFIESHDTRPNVVGLAASIDTEDNDLETTINKIQPGSNVAVDESAKGKVDELKRPKTGGGPGGAQPTPSESIFIESHDTRPNVVGLAASIDTEDNDLETTINKIQPGSNVAVDESDEEGRTCIESTTLSDKSIQALRREIEGPNYRQPAITSTSATTSSSKQNQSKKRTHMRTRYSRDQLEEELLLLEIKRVKMEIELLAMKKEKTRLETEVLSNQNQMVNVLCQQES
ncbi:myb/SANT-like DNA-binding domain-containing protein 4 [Argopecten irradians]|uniref:myb/SANT-like DNA-binding domain-containing protein 4 n=1 Tax=Argopecten irradians TaxID=31199 RepID=UPI003713B3E6